MRAPWLCLRTRKLPLVRSRSWWKYILQLPKYSSGLYRGTLRRIPKEFVYVICRGLGPPCGVNRSPPREPPAYFSDLGAHAPSVHARNASFLLFGDPLFLIAMGDNNETSKMYTVEAGATVSEDSIVTCVDDGNPSSKGGHFTMSQQLLLQYIILRKDLQNDKGWSTGALIAQACHACLSVISATWTSAQTQMYLEQGQSMRTVVLQAENEDVLRKLASVLQQKRVKHALWTEQPENVPSCIAVQPLPKGAIYPLVKGLKLFT